MLLGQELAQAILEMGLSRTEFAKLVGVKEPTVANWIKNPHVKPTVDEKMVEAVLKKRCRCCGQYTEKEDAWNHSAPGKGKGGKRSA